MSNVLMPLMGIDDPGVIGIMIDDVLMGQVVPAPEGDPAGSWYGVTEYDGEPFDSPDAAAAYVVRTWLAQNPQGKAAS